MTALEALQTYFGYEQFRPLQDKIVESVLAGKDTLALLPTGGGKSICFQVPTLVHDEGLCLVVTPLIALMKDQVENLRRRDIRAAAIYTGMSRDQQRVAIDNCMFGPYRFLYVSPERLESEEFRRKLAELPIVMIAVDEAHCISQWGYDFRPSYLKISEIRALLPKQVPILALTATATPEVAEDIQQQLLFRAPNVIRQSFARENLSYLVRYCKNSQDTHSAGRTKTEELQHIVSRMPQSRIIVYVRNRKRAEELADILGCPYYHAGLSPEERTRRQEAWDGIMVCTNAFGMGIDKPDVRLVIHYDLPDSPEAYFQEAGRAGRDGQPAYAVLLYAPEDKAKVQKRVADNYPPREFVEDVYHKTADFLCVGAGSGLGHSFALHIDELCHTMRLPVLQTYSALHLLTQAGYIDFQEEQDNQARVMVNVPLHTLREYQLSAEQEGLLHSLLRKYPGVMTELKYLHGEITETIHQTLTGLAARHIITYIPRTRACRVTFVQERQTEVYLPRQAYEKREDAFKQRLHAMMEYAEQTSYCRSQLLLSYFGETDAPCCGTCDVCRSKKG